MESSYSEFEAIGFALVGFTFWVLADSMIKMLGSSKLPAFEVVAFLGFFAASFLLLRGLWRKEVKSLWPKRPKRQIVRSSLDLVNNLCVVVALRHLPLTLFYILVFMAPMVTAILAALFLHERLDWRKSMAIIAGFVGVIVAVDPFGTARPGSWIGVAACMVCVACFSANVVWSRTITQTESPESLVFFSGLVMAAYGFGRMLAHAEPLTARLTAGLCAMGFFCAFGSVCFFIALKHTSAANVSQYHYTQLISGALIAYLFWREIPGISMLSGGVLIVGSGLYIAMRASRERPDGCSLSPVVLDKSNASISLTTGLR
jgi:drug/metabolite transporter (DMT)-like permease